MPSPVQPLPICLDHGPNIPGSCAILFFTALDLSSITSHIHNWLPELKQDWEIDSQRAQQNLGHQDPEERSSDPTGDFPGLACGCPGVSAGGAGWCWPAAGLAALSVAVCAWNLLREVTIILITWTIVWPQVNSKEGTQLHPSTENWINNSMSMAQSIRTRPSFPLSQFLPPGSFHKAVINFHQRGDRLKNTIIENLITWTTVLSNTV